MSASLKVSRPAQRIGGMVATVDIVVVDDGILVSVRRSSTRVLGLSRKSRRVGNLPSPRGCPGHSPGSMPSNNLAVLLALVVLCIMLRLGGNGRHRRRLVSCRRCRRVHRGVLGGWLGSGGLLSWRIGRSLFGRGRGRSRSRLSGDGLGDRYHREVGDILPLIDRGCQCTGCAEGAQQQ